MARPLRIGIVGCGDVAYRHYLPGLQGVADLAHVVALADPREGAAEGMVEIGVNPWDLAGPQVVVEEAGGLLTDLDGEPRIDRLEVLASNGVLHRELLVRLRQPGVPVA